MSRQCLLQLSDIHIGLEGENTHSIDVRAQFLSCLQAGIKRGVDLIVVSGDIAFHAGNPEIYRWVYKQLQQTGVPWVVIPGNHDNPEQVATCFHQEDWYRTEQDEMYQTIQTESRKIILLDSAKSDISTMQYNWLHDQLEETTLAPLIFLHHPPTVLDMNFMENPYHGPRPKLLHLIEEKAANSHIFVGHYHIDRVLCRAKSTIYACPSTYFQIDPTEKSFAIESQRPGYALIQFDKEIVMRTTHYLQTQHL